MKRVIPCLLYSNGGLYKTTRFKKRKYIGDPINSIKLFSDLEVDELIILDIDASRENSGPNYSLINDIANECFMPVCYGGGIKTIDGVSRLLSIGVEKVSINSKFIEDKGFATELANTFGSQSIVCSLDVKTGLFGKKYLYNYLLGKFIKEDILEYAKSLESAGVGELFLTSVDHEGTMSGLDLEILD
ncbi:MAG: imidazole glycerol phosphate synthase subunit HisF, partial [Flavobacteriaceae bacterium]|nr:imidazole glycerol phosphate synthase subunit HisF [Flavobacteriaceae bacterium]